jgi:hypothetical protein
MRSEIVGSSGERPTVKEAVGRFSVVFLASQIYHAICTSQVSSYVLRPVVPLRRDYVECKKSITLDNS